MTSPGQTCVARGPASTADLIERALPPTDHVDLPQVEGITIDGKLDDWAGRGLSIEVLAAAHTERRRVDQFDAEARIGWDREGLLLAFDIVDQSHVESEKDAQLYERDSIELFFAKQPGADDFVQLVLSPGMDPKHPKPRVRLYDRRSSPVLRAVEPPVSYAREATSRGYRLEARLPWALLGTEAKLGSEAGLQFYVNDWGAVGDKRKLIWFPEDETHQRSSRMHRVRLSAPGSARVTAATSTRFIRPHKAELELAMVAQTADVIRLIGEGSLASSTALTLDGRLATAKLEFLALLAEQPPRPLVLADSHGPIIRVWQPDRSVLRQKLLGSLGVHASPAVFHGDKFPAVFLRDWWLGEMLLGAFKLNTRFYDAQHRLVDKPTQPGRYGAVVDIVAAQGPGERRTLTLFRTKEKTFWSSERASPALDLPASIGISPEVQKRQTAILGRLLLQSIPSSTYLSEDAAIILAYLSELGPNDAAAGPLEAAYQANHAWWREQRRQMGDPRPYKYLVHLPPAAVAGDQQLHPAILSLHGAGEVGDDLGMVAQVGPLRKLRQNPAAFPFIVLTPQCPAAAHRWDVHLLADLVREALAKYPIDPERLYVIGGSMGGFGTWAVAAAHAELFAAAAVVSGGGDAEDAHKLADLPVWVLHGDDDDVVPLARGLEIVRALRERRGRVRFTLFHGVGHDAGTPTFEGDQVYAWFLEQRRGHPKQPRTKRTDIGPDDTGAPVGAGAQR